MTVALVAGALANKAGNAGAAWTRLSWALGLRTLGFDVHLVEQLAPGVDGEGAAWFRRVTEGFGLPATLLAADAATVHGLDVDELTDLAADAPLLLNITGHLRLSSVLDQVGTRVFVDLDPGYTQLWHAQGIAPLAPHDHWYTVGTAIGSASCPLPTGGLPWRPILQPVLVDEWPALEPRGPDRFTTVAAWRGPYGTVELDGRPLGPKAHEFRRFLPLPDRVGPRLELALDIDDADAADRDALIQHGWQLADPRRVAATPGAFRSYVQASDGEWSVAQGLYAASRCGWVSDRTTRYLSSGRPAIVQDTGVDEAVPLGEGLLTFTTPDEAADAISAVADDYERHCRAARALAEDLFAAPVVLGRLCEEVGVAP